MQFLNTTEAITALQDLGCDIKHIEGAVKSLRDYQSTSMNNKNEVLNSIPVGEQSALLVYGDGRVILDGSISSPELCEKALSLNFAVWYEVWVNGWTVLKPKS